MKRYIFLLLALFATTLSAFAQEATAEQTEAIEQTATEQTTEQTEVAEQTTAQQSDNDTLWERANAAYNEGKYSTAAELYESILADKQHSAKLYFNLGNAYYKQDKLGKAILNYHRALRLAPADEDVRHNLEYATQATKDNIEEIPVFFLTSWVRSVRDMMGCNGWTALSLVALCVALIGTLAYLLAQRLSLRKAGFYVMGVAALLFVVSTIFALNKRHDLVSGEKAIIMSSAAPIKSSPDRAATDLFVLHEGTSLTLGESIDGWVEIRIADGRKGWIESSRIERI